MPINQQNSVEKTRERIAEVRIKKGIKTFLRDLVVDEDIDNPNLFTYVQDVAKYYDLELVAEQRGIQGTYLYFKKTDQ